ncbi:hypothetical protein ACU4GH_31365 [Bradyrhizobium betae]
MPGRNLATVGLCEREARARHTQMKVYKSTFRPAAQADGAEPDGKVFIKLVVAGAEERVVGVHMVGPDAGEIIRSRRGADLRRHQSAIRRYTRQPPDHRGGMRQAALVR